MSKIQEQDLAQKVSEFLIGQGYKVRAEVSNLGQSADLVATKGRWVTCIEVKVHDWRTALSQCVAHKLVADYICIAVGTKKVSANLYAAAAESGIGLIHVDLENGCRWAAKPPVNGTIWRPQRKQFSLRLQAAEYVC